MHLSSFKPVLPDGLPKVIFFGTHDFGAAMLQAIIDTARYEIVAIVTQPDRAIGRSSELQKPAVKQLAEKYNLMVLQPENLHTFARDFQLGDTDLCVVCQYGLIIPQSVLSLPKHGAINVHTSLLPKYRGASPIQTALINGEKSTGVTTMLMDAKMDHGAILLQKKVAIDDQDTYETLSEKMKPVATALLVETLEKWLSLQLHPTVQDEEDATFCKQFSRESGRVDWHQTPVEIYNLQRGLTPWPGIWTTWNGLRLKLIRFTTTHIKGVPIGVAHVHNGHLLFGCKSGALEINELQPEGKKPMDVKSFLNGYSEIAGDKLNT